MIRTIVTCCWARPPPLRTSQEPHKDPSWPGELANLFEYRALLGIWILQNCKLITRLRRLHGTGDQRSCVPSPGARAPCGHCLTPARDSEFIQQFGISSDDYSNDRHAFVSQFRRSTRNSLVFGRDYSIPFVRVIEQQSPQAAPSAIDETTTFLLHCARQRIDPRGIRVWYFGLQFLRAPPSPCLQGRGEAQ